VLHPKKVGTLPIEGDSEVQKQTNEIGMTIPLLDAIAIQGKTITADALLTQRKIADYVVNREADYHFTVKNNQPTLRQDIALFFENRQEPDFIDYTPPDHGRIETRKIWTTTALNQYLDFPHIGQAFVIERESIEKKTGKYSHEIVYGITSCSSEKANAEKILKTNREHWSIENSCHYVIDWNYNEDRCRISKGYGPENITRLRRFAVGLIKSKGADCVAQKIRELVKNTRLVFDYLKMTKNSCAVGCSG
jgi:predicted transposase YbfD/YdcC